MKINLLFIAIIIFLFNQLPAQTGYNDDWFWQYPKPQGNTLWNIKALDQNTAIATGDFGTFIKTTDGGKSWDVKSNSNEVDYWLNTYFINKEKGWSVSGQYIYATEDGGKNWETIYDNTDGIFTGVFFLNDQTGWVFRTDIPPEDVLKTGFCLRTTDGGKTWNSYVIGFDCVPSNPYFISPDTGWVFTSGFYPAYFLGTTDGGISWTPKPINPNIYGLQDVCFLDRNNWSLVSIEGFSKTTNSGQTWINQNISGPLYSVKFINADTGWVVGSNGIIGTDTGNVSFTSDGGATWIKQNINITEFLHSIDYSDGTCWAAGQYGVIYRTTDLGSNWIPLKDEEYHFNSIYFIDENTGWVVGEEGIILHTSDGGNNWIKQYQNDSLILNSVYAVDNENVFAVGSVLDVGHYPQNVKNAVILYSNNSGQEWETQISESLFVYNSIFFVNESIGWITGTELLKTENKGNTFIKISSASNIPREDIQFVNGNIGWGTVYGDYNILKTTDGGKIWKSTCIDSTFTIYSFHFINADIGWAAGIGHDPITYYWDKYIYKTTDGGDSWIQCKNVPQFVYSSIKFINEKTGWASGALSTGTSTIIKSTDGGNSWFEQKSPTREGISQFYFINDNIGYAIGYDGIYKTTNGGGIVSVKDDKENKKSIPTQIELKQNYPNPFNPTTTVNYSIPTPPFFSLDDESRRSRLDGRENRGEVRGGFVTLKVYDILGREIATLVNEEKKPGSYNVTFNADKYNLSSGVYFYRIQAGEFSQTRKFILQK